jgi:hypothetical protein
MKKEEMMIQKQKSHVPHHQFKDFPAYVGNLNILGFLLLQLASTSGQSLPWKTASPRNLEFWFPNLCDIMIQFCFCDKS